MSKTTVKIIDGYVIEIMHNNSLYLVDIEPIILDGNNLDLKYNHLFFFFFFFLNKCALFLYSNLKPLSFGSLCSIIFLIIFIQP